MSILWTPPRNGRSMPLTLVFLENRACSDVFLRDHYSDFLLKYEKYAI
jgi:hypothetical protein